MCRVLWVFFVCFILFVDLSFQLFWVKTRKHNLLDCMVIVYLVLKEVAKLSSKMAMAFYILTRTFYQSTPSLEFGGVGVLEFGHSNRCVVVSYGFNLQFSDDMMQSIFSYTICHLDVFGEMSVQALSILKSDQFFIVRFKEFFVYFG